MANSDEFVYTVDATLFRAEIDAMERQQKELRRGLADAAAEAVKGSRAAAAALHFQLEELDNVSVGLVRAKGAYKAMADEREKAAASAETSRIQSHQLPIVNPTFELAAAAISAENAQLAVQDVELHKINQQLAEKQERIARLRAAAAAGDADALRMLNEEIKSTIVLNDQKRKLEKTFTDLAKPVGAMNRLSSQSSQVIGQLSFAVDDALTVFGQTGFAGAARAAGNNLSYVLSIVNPMLAIVPALGTAIAFTLIPRLMGWSEASKKVNEETEKQIATMEKLQDAVNSVTMAEGDLAAAKNAREFSDARGKAQKDVTEKRDAVKKVAGQRSSMKVSMPPVLEKAIGNLLYGDEEKMKDDEAIARRTLADIDAKQAAYNEGVKQKALQKRAEKSVARISAPLQKAAEEALGAGATPDQIRTRIEKGVRDQLPPELKPFAAEQAAKISEAANESAETKKIEGLTKPPSNEASEERRRKQRETQAKLAMIQADKSEAEAASPRGKLNRVQEREFDQQMRPLEAELKRLSAQLSRDKNSDEQLKETMKHTDFLKTISGFLEKWTAEPDWAKSDRRPTL